MRAISPPPLVGESRASPSGISVIHINILLLFFETHKRFDIFFPWLGNPQKV